MKLKFALALTIGLACFPLTRGQEGKPVLPGTQGTKPQAPATQGTKPQQPTVQALSAEDLAGRFDRSLADSLDSEGVCLSYRAVRALEYVANDAAVQIVRQNRLGELRQAETNLALFARALVEEAKKSSGGKITDATISVVLRGSPEINKSGVCPLFPVCK